MSVFAPEEAMSNPGNHPPLEELAAYIDGMLSEEEAARVAEHIAECEDCFFVYSETVRFQLEHPDEVEDPADASEEAAEVISFPPRTEETRKRKPLPWWLGIAAAAVLVVAVGIPVYRSLNQPSMPEMTTAELLKPVQGAPDLRGNLYDFRRIRGHGGNSDYERHSFMVGVFLTDLRAALENEDASDASERLQRIHALLDQIGGMDEEVRLQRQVQRRLETSSNPKAFLPVLEQWEKEAGNNEDALWVVDPDYITFGKWAEAGRLAAVLRRQEFFDNEKNRRVLSYVLQSKEMAPEENVVAHLQEIQSLWDKGNLQPQDFAALEDKFEEILRAYDFTA